MLSIDNNATARGFIKLLQTDVNTGITTTLVEKPNLILYSGADLLSYAIAGQANAKISHMYVGFRNGTSTFTAPTIDLANSVPMSAYATPFGYLRIPLAFTPSFLSTVNHTHNIPVFSVSIGYPISQGGAPLNAPTDSNTGSWLFEVALVSAQSTIDTTQDVVFSRANFVPVQYNPNFALTLQWGIEFKAS